MTLGRRLFLAAVLVVAGTSVACAPEDISTQKAVEEHLTCQCGCGLTVHTCNHLQCSFAVPVKGDVSASLAAGQPAQQILDRYVDEYGEKILSSPTAVGFNLVAWYGPYVALLLGGIGIWLAARRWSRLAAIEASHSEPHDAARTDAERARLRRELEDLGS